MFPRPGAQIPYVAFPNPVPLPLPDIGDAPLICVTINEVWVEYIVGCLQALTAQSTWDSSDENAVNTTIRRARNLIDVFAQFEACPMPIEFRVNPGDTEHWQYSLDGGGTWSDGPATTFPVQATDYVKTDPVVDITQIIAGISGVDTLQIQALAAFGAKLRSNAVTAYLSKYTGATPTADGVLQIQAPDSYDWPLIETVS